MRLRLENEGRDALGGLCGLGFGVDDHVVGVGPVGDPHLGAVEEISAVDFFGCALHADDVAARRVLAHGQRAHLVARYQPRQVLFLLRRRPVEHELVDAELRVRGVG